MPEREASLRREEDGPAERPEGARRSGDIRLRLSQVEPQKRGPKRRKGTALKRSPFKEKSGGVLLSQAVSRQVPSAQEGLTSVFGMGTGVTPPP